MWIRRQPSLGSDCALILLLFVTFGAATARAQNCKVLPGQIKLGDTLRIACPAEFTSAKLNDRSAKLYLQPNGKRFGLLPISVKDTPGTFPLILSTSDGSASQTLRVVIRKTIFPSQNVTLAPEIEALHPIARLARQ